MFPYNCQICHGGFFRCGNTFCAIENCQGSNTCWEDDVVLEIIQNVIQNTDHNNVEEIISFGLENIMNPVYGVYSGYGFYEVEGCGIRFYDINQVKSGCIKEQSENYFLVKAYCASCFRKFQTNLVI